MSFVETFFHFWSGHLCVCVFAVCTCVCVCIYTILVGITGIVSVKTCMGQLKKLEKTLNQKKHKQL